MKTLLALLMSATATAADLDFAPASEIVKSARAQTKLAAQGYERKNLAPITDAPGIKVGEIAPSFSLPDATGKRWRLADSRGSVVVLDFWEATCAPCVNRFGRLAKLEGGGVIVAGVESVYSAASRAHIKARTEGVPYPMLLDDLGNVARTKYRSQAPFVVVIGRDGVVAAVFVGREDIVEPLTEAVQKALEAPAKG